MQNVKRPHQLEVVASTADRVTQSSKQPEDQADDQNYVAERPQERDSSEIPNDEQNETNGNHDASYDRCPLLSPNYLREGQK